MKIKTRSRLVALVLAIVAGFNPFASAQRIAIIGTVKSSLGSAAVKDAEVYIYEQTGKTLLESCVANALGKFTTERVFKANQKVRIKIIVAGFEEKQLDHTVGSAAGGSNIGQVLLQPLMSVEGVIKSDQGANISGVTINILGSDGNIINATTSDVSGKYKSDKVIKNGTAVTIVAKKPGFSEGTETRTILNVPTGVVTVNFTLRTMTVISGFVSDSVTSEPLSGVEISFFEGSKLISTTRTNQQGYYDFDALNFGFGDRIKIRAEKKGYWPKESPLSLIRGENRQDFLLPKWEDRGIKVNVRVYGKKNKPLEGTKVLYNNGKTDKEDIAPANGEISLRIFQPPGTILKMRILKSGYREQLKEHTLGNPILGTNYVDIYMEKAGSLCPCFLYPGLGVAAFSGVMYQQADESYDRSKNFKNLDADSDYDRANTRLRTAHVAAGVAGLAIAGWLFCKSKEKKREAEDLKKRKRSSFVPLLQPGNPQGGQFGIAYRF